ncbi:hypothetical protein FG386_003643 [Cryptosporidium ryanae]|uniref:uncharacterized protein n=1 Tax=Cryptosporidium ryanae TaxID=515981 RepID=UPI003519DD24|nr:hypothetical protein FG386_003643 [Cryptosporidium ryanae]
MEHIRAESFFKKDEYWKESEKRFLKNEFRGSRESLESVISPNSEISSCILNDLSGSSQELSEDFLVNIDEENKSDEIQKFSNIPIINTVFCDISSVKYTTYSEVKSLFYFLSIFFLILSFLLFERTWNNVSQIKINYDNFGGFPKLLKEGITYSNENYTSQENNSLYEFTTDRALYDPVFVYYGIDGFFSNTKEFVSSKPQEVFGYGYKCTHILTIEDFIRYRPDIRKHIAEFFRVPEDFDFKSIDKLFISNKKKTKIFNIGKNHSYTNILCGLPMYSIFTDEIEIINKDHGNLFIRTNIDCQEDQWKYKLLHNFRQFVISKINNSYFYNKSNTGKQKIKEPIPKLSIMLSRWWTQSISPNFIKIYGIISSSNEYSEVEDDIVLYPGSYELNVTSNIFPNNKWGTEKYILLMNLSVFGGRQYLPAAICLFISLVYAVIIYFDPKRAQIIIIKNKIDQ